MRARTSFGAMRRRRSKQLESINLVTRYQVRLEGAERRVFPVNIDSASHNCKLNA